MPRRQTCVIMKTCSLTRHVCHSERGSVISDCLVNVCISIVSTRVLLFVCFRSVHHPVKRFPTYTALLGVASEEVPYLHSFARCCQWRGSLPTQLCSVLPVKRFPTYTALLGVASEEVPYLHSFARCCQWRGSLPTQLCSLFNPCLI